MISMHSHYTAPKLLDYSCAKNEGLVLEGNYRGEPSYVMIDLCCRMSGENVALM